MAPTRTPRNSARSQSLQKKKVVINVYDLLPPGRFSSVVWTLGVSLLHSGVVINDREYAFGGHDRQGLTGVYWTKPRTEPPGGTFREEILHGFTYASDQEIEEIVREVCGTEPLTPCLLFSQLPEGDSANPECGQASDEFLGPTYNLLTRNCNHFTSHLCSALTGQPAPKYLNRAASIGVALPCVVPAGWVEPPECEVEDDQGESARLTQNAEGGSSSARAGDGWESTTDGGNTSDDSDDDERQRRRMQMKKVKDTSGRELPPAERARFDTMI